MKITGNLDANSNKVIGLSDPTSAQDAATKAYVDAAIQGLKWKEPVRAASTANLTLSGTQTIDGVACIAGDRVLAKNQTTTANNGVYIVGAGAWARASDLDVSAEALGAAFFVSEGSTQGNQQWQLTTDGPITLGSTGLTFAQFGGGSSYTQGNGISITGSSIAVDASVVARKASATIGDGSTTTITVTHNLNTQDVAVSVRDASTNAGVLVDWVANGVNTVQLTFAIAPASNAYRATIIG